jgi:hypothetical protein
MDDAFKIDKMNVIRFSSFGDFLYNDEPIQTIQRINTRKVDEFCVMRNWIYKILKDDFRPIFKKYDIGI